MSSRDHAAVLEQYVADVLSGAVPACLYVRQACERHRRDITNVNSKFIFDAAKARRACAFIETLPHIKGEWARRKELIVLRPWQVFIVGSLFGWLRKADGLRRFREAYAEIPRKNTKSTLAAGIGLYMFTADGEEGAEVYSGATSEKQAHEVFGPARLMAARARGFKDHYKVTVGIKALAIVDRACKFEPLIGKPGDGASPHCAIVDEYHEHATDELYETMLTGMGARSQPLMLAITTAGSNLAGPCYQKRAQAIKVLAQADGFENDELFAIIYTVDADDDWADFECWKKANPNFGVSVREDFLRSRHRDATQIASRQNAIRTKNLNQWMNARTAWMNPLHWQACADESLKLDDFAGRPCYLGVDLATRDDIAAVMLAFPDGEGLAVFGHYFVPDETVERPENEHYRRWQIDGTLTVTDGPVTDIDQIEDDIRELCTQYDVRAVGYDPFQAAQMSQHLMADGVPMVEVRPTVLNFSEAMKELGALVLKRAVRHDGDPALAWMMSNVVAKTDAKDNIYPRKEQPQNKIDGVVALIMCVSQWMAERNDDPYSERGLLTL